jgi:hypothetical protein
MICEWVTADSVAAEGNLPRACPYRKLQSGHSRSSTRLRRVDCSAIRTLSGSRLLSRNGVTVNNIPRGAARCPRAADRERALRASGPRDPGRTAWGKGQTDNQRLHGDKSYRQCLGYWTKYIWCWQNCSADSRYLRRTERSTLASASQKSFNLGDWSSK